MNQSVQSDLQQEVEKARQEERERCAEIIQMAREDEIDRDWRAIIHIIEGGMSIDEIKRHRQSR